MARAYSLRNMECDTPDDTYDRAEARCESVDSVDEIDGIDEEHENHDCEGVTEPR